MVENEPNIQDHRDEKPNGTNGDTPEPTSQSAPTAQPAGPFASVERAWGDLVSASPVLPELVAAVLVSNAVAKQLGSGPVWLLLVGPPASGKTEATEAAKDTDQAYYLDTLTENSFITGYIRDDGKSKDLLPELADKVLVVKDMAPLLSGKDDSVAKILGDLTGIYDGSFSKFTGTRGKISYNTTFPMLACCTTQIIDRHSRLMSAVGPRFLSYRVSPLDAAAREKAADLVWNSENQPAKKKVLLAAMRDLVKGVMASPAPVFAVDESDRKTLIGLAHLIAAGRSVVSYAQVGGNSEPDSVQKEEPWRALHQLRTLACSLAWVNGRAEITSHELDIVRAVAFSTMPTARVGLLALFDGTSSGGITCKQCEERLHKSRRRIGQILQEFIMAGVLIKTKSPTGKEDTFEPAPEFAALLRSAVDSPNGGRVHELEIDEEGWDRGRAD